MSDFSDPWSTDQLDDWNPHQGAGAGQDSFARVSSPSTLAPQSRKVRSNMATVSGRAPHPEWRNAIAQVGYSQQQSPAAPSSSVVSTIAPTKSDRAWLIGGAAAVVAVLGFALYMRRGRR